MVQFGSRFLNEDYVSLQCDATTWDWVGQGEHSCVVYWEGGVPHQGRRLVRGPPELAHHFTAVGGFSRVADAG